MATNRLSKERPCHCVKIKAKTNSLLIYKGGTGSPTRKEKMLLTWRQLNRPRQSVRLDPSSRPSRKDADGTTAPRGKDVPGSCNQFVKRHTTTQLLFFKSSHYLYDLKFQSISFLSHIIRNNPFKLDYFLWPLSYF